MDPVATGARAGQEKHIAGSVGGRAGQVLDACDADAHRVHERVLGIAVVEVDFAGHVGNADAIAVPADAVHDSPEQPSVPGGVRRAETEGVQQGDGPRSHGEDVTHDAAHAGCRPLQRLHGGRVVVGLDLENNRQSVAYVDGAGILGAGLGECPVRARRQHSQQRTRVFVSAVLAPEGAEHAQFNRVRLPVKPVDDHVVLRLGQRDFVENFLANRHCRL